MNWFDVDNANGLEREVETPLGDAIMTIRNYKVSVKLVKPITLFRVKYDCVISAELRLSREEWVFSHYTVRTNNKHAFATKTARNHIESLMYPWLETWLEHNYAMLSAGEKAYTAARIERGRQRAQAAIRAAEARLAKLDAMEQGYEATGYLSDDNKRLIDDVYHWRF